MSSEERGFFGAFLRGVRQEKGWTQATLAAEFNREQAWISRLENNNNEGYLPAPDTLRRLAQLLNTPVEALILSAFGLAHRAMEIDLEVPPGQSLHRFARLVSENVALGGEQQRFLLNCVDAAARWFEVSESLERCHRPFVDRSEQARHPAT